MRWPIVEASTSCWKGGETSKDNIFRILCDKEVRKIFLEYSKLQQVIVMNLSVAGKEVRQVKIIFLEYSKLQHVS